MLASSWLWLRQYTSSISGNDHSSSKEFDQAAHGLPPNEQSIFLDTVEKSATLRFKDA